MTRYAYHAAHEQFTPSRLLRCVQRAEAAGFDAAMCSDHFHPWSEAQGQSGYAWSWLGAALQATRFPIGTITAPGQRYHPAIIAQAAATLEELFPGRFWVAYGSGQALNEAITGDRWPPKGERNARVEECAEVTRRLWSGETVTHHGLIRVEEATLYTRPSAPPPLFGAALTPETARWVGSWADGLLTSSAPPDALRGVIEAFREGGGDGKPVYVQANHVFAEDVERARKQAHEQWRTNVLGPLLQSELRLPASFEAAAALVRVEDMDGPLRISDSPEQHAEWLLGDVGAGADAIFIHHIAPDQEQFIDAFGAHVLPLLREAEDDTGHSPGRTTHRDQDGK